MSAKTKAMLAEQQASRDALLEMIASFAKARRGGDEINPMRLDKRPKPTKKNTIKNATKLAGAGIGALQKYFGNDYSDYFAGSDGDFGEFGGGIVGQKKGGQIKKKTKKSAKKSIKKSTKKRVALRGQRSELRGS